MELPLDPRICTRRAIGKFESLEYTLMKCLKEVFLNPQQDTRLSRWVQLVLGSGHCDPNSLISEQPPLLPRFLLFALPINILLKWNNFL